MSRKSFLFQIFILWAESNQIKHKRKHSRELKPEVTDHKVLIILWKASFFCAHPHRFSLSSAIFSDWNPEFVVKENIFWIQFYIWREIAFRCWPVAFGRWCSCGSGLVILVQTEVWSSLTSCTWLLEEAFALCHYIGCLKHSSCAVFFSLWCFRPFLSFRTLIWQFDIKQMLWKLNVQCHRHRILLILMISPSQTCHVEFPSTHRTWGVFFNQTVLTDIRDTCSCTRSVCVWSSSFKCSAWRRWLHGDKDDTKQSTLVFLHTTCKLDKRYSTLTSSNLKNSFFSPHQTTCYVWMSDVWVCCVGACSSLCLRVPRQVLCSKPWAHQSPIARVYLLFLNSQWRDWQPV